MVRVVSRFVSCEDSSSAPLQWKEQGVSAQTHQQIEIRRKYFAFDHGLAGIVLRSDILIVPI